MVEEAAVERYEPGPAFEEVKEEAMLDMSPTDSKEFWLIQWIKDKDLNVSDFHGKELSLKLHKDGNLGSLESSSGKSYDLVSFAYQQPNATVFLPSGSETKAVGKISRRVCLVRHREHEELEKPNFGSLTPSSKKSAEAQHPKNQLQFYAQKRGMQLPLYCPMQIGPPHEPLFKSKVVIDGLTFESPEEYRTLKAAEVAAAKFALMSLPQAARNFGSLTPSSKKSAGSSRKALAKKKKKERKGPDSSTPVLGGSDMQNAMSMQSSGQEIQNGEPGPSVPKISTVTCYKTNDSDAVGKISREHEELEKPNIGSLTPSSKKSAGSSKKALAKKKKISRFIATRLAKYCSSQGPVLSVGAMSEEQTPEHNRKREDVGHSDVSGKTSEGPDARGAQSNTATEMPQTTPEEPPKKKVKIAEQ